ncbi:MAG: chorismate mutase [Rhizobiales bacterium TMED83]|jgi:isochorismate pyruvate lyase|nr:chorismate mutase [Rhodobiaceae bacterium]RPF93036.1 MAG: chorismate mutase [Rhizobiales bacterium TMED83]HCD17780.1 chorismate mutase [Rhodobiaceae bacterium]
MNARAPVPCPEMIDIRDRIDHLDKQLVALLAQRQRLIEAAGKVKPARQTVRDEARIEEVIRHVLAEARVQNLSTDIAEPVWRQLIESSIAYEFSVFDKR